MQTKLKINSYKIVDENDNIVDHHLSVRTLRNGKFIIELGDRVALSKRDLEMIILPFNSSITDEQWEEISLDTLEEAHALVNKWLSLNS